MGVEFDADFHTLLALSGTASPSVIRIRIEGLGAGRLADLVNTTVRKCQAQLEAGTLVLSSAAACDCAASPSSVHGSENSDLAAGLWRRRGSTGRHS